MSARFDSSRCVLAAVVLAFLPLVACGGGSVEESETSETVSVSVEPARRGPVRSVVRATAVVAPAPGGEQIIGAPGPARIVEIPHGVGDRALRKGDVLVRFEIPSLEADVGARMSDLQRAQARLENASAARERVQALFERGVAARKEVEDAQREMSEAEAALSEAKSAGSAAALSAQRLTVRALFDGVVAARAHNPGDLVDAANEMILRVLDPDRLEVNASIPAHELPRIHEGSLATVSLFSDPAHPARVRSLPVSVDPLTAMATVRLDFVQNPHLPAGTPVQVSIFAAERQDALLVPSGALVREGEDTFVYTVDAENKAHRKQVTLGLVSDADVEILSGLEAGESVIVRGQSGLPDGAAVAPGS